MAKIEINLTEKERIALQELSLMTGKTDDELIHDAIENLIKRRLPSSKSGMLKARGIWKDRNDLPDFGKVRREVDRL